MKTSQINNGISLKDKALFGWLEKRLMLTLMLVCYKRKILLFR